VSRTERVLRRFSALGLRLSTAAWALALAGALVLLLGAAAWAARLGWFGQPWWVLATWGLVVLVAGALAVAAVREARGYSPRWVARELEQRGFRQGFLGGHLEPAAAGTSPDLLAAADLHHATELETRGPPLVEGLLAPLRKRALAAGALLLLGLTVLLTARPTRGQPALLWQPGEAWAATRAPITLTLAAREVERGDSLRVAALARGRRHAILWTRAPGETWKGRGLVLDSLGRADVVLGPLESDLFLRLTSGGRTSDTLQVKVRIPAFLGTLAVVARYPRYLDLEDEPLPTDGDTIVIPAGTRLETQGEATAELTAAAWEGGGSSAALEVIGSRFRGSFTPAGARTWTLALATRSGDPLAGDTVRIPVVTVPDSAPRVSVPVPGQDTLVPLSLVVPLVIDAEDDHGVTRVVLESRRVSRLGEADPPRLEPLPLPEGARDRIILPLQLDLNRRGLNPGDTLRFLVRVSDNAPRPQVGVSREFVLRLPTMSEVREAARATAEQVGRRLDSIAEAGRQLERQTEDLAQERPRESERGEGTGNNDALSYENAKRAESVARSQEELIREAEEVERALDELQRSAEAAGINDPAWQERLREIQEQLERALTPELRERLAELQRALEELDPERTREALERLAEAQQQLREALERSRELFKRAALEGDLANLTAEARELTEEQRQWIEQATAGDSARLAREEGLLSQRADSLAAALERLGQQMAEESPERQPAVEQSADRAEQAAEQMRQASRAMQQGQRQQAQQQGQQALSQLSPLEQELTEQREGMQSAWRQEVVEALDRVLADASRLAERQLAVSERLRNGDASPQVRSEQGAIEEGVQRLLDQVAEVAGKNALVGQQSSVALAAGRDQMRRAREALQNAAPNAREAARRSAEAVDALNAAAHALLRSRGQVEGAGSGSGLAEAMEQMQQMAQQQGQIGQQSGGMLPMMGQGGAMQEQLRQLGARQRALAERMERLRAGGQIPGAGDMADEARELARTLEAGRLDRQTVERQERLFRRMLDAGRTLQGQEEDERQERQSTTASGDSVRLPPALRARLSEERLRYPSWEELQALSPEERRRVTEYFRRLSAAPRPAPAGDEPAPMKE
jgi:hypothetical protein